VATHIPLNVANTPQLSNKCRSTIYTPHPSRAKISRTELSPPFHFSSTSTGFILTQVENSPVYPTPHNLNEVYPTLKVHACSNQSISFRIVHPRRTIATQKPYFCHTGMYSHPSEHIQSLYPNGILTVAFCNTKLTDVTIYTQKTFLVSDEVYK